MVSKESVKELFLDIGQHVNPDIIDHIFYLACSHFDNKYVFPTEEIEFEDYLTIAKSKSGNELLLEITRNEFYSL